MVRTSSKEEFLALIKPDMHLSMEFFKRMYSYELSYPEFSKEAIARLRILGYRKAEEYYQQFVSAYEQKRDEEMKRVAEWYIKQDFSKKKEGEELRKKERETEQWKNLLLEEEELLQRKKEILMLRNFKG